MTERIPNVFHFIFGLKEQTEPFHIAFYLCLESCIQVNQPEKIFLYYHHQPYGRYWDLIKDKLDLVPVDLVPCVSNHEYPEGMIKKHYRYAHHSDFIRMEKLIEHGGVYADMDTIFVNRLPEPLYDKPFVLGHEGNVPCPNTKELRPSVCNALIMSRAKAEFARHYYRKMEAALDGTWSNHSCFLAYELSQRYPHLVHLEPARSFYKHLWTKSGIHMLFEGCDSDYKGVYSMHLWSHLWWSKRRRDFSRFYAGRLTERYIRKVDTTYNLVARKYLPPRRRRYFFQWWDRDQTTYQVAPNPPIS